MLPNLVIIGAMKCGTVSLHKYLSCHPEILMAPLKELDFFVAEKNWQKGLDWYQSHFPQPAKVVGERSTAYSKFPDFKGIPERMNRLIPEAKLIYCIRNPIDRIISQYVHWYIRGYENRDFEEAVAENFPNNPYLNYSRYFMQIEQFLPYFPISNIFVLRLEKLAKERRETIRQVFAFLDVAPDFDHPDFYQEFHKSAERKRPTKLYSYIGHMRGMHRLKILWPSLFLRPVRKPEISQSFRQEINEALREDVDKLNSFIETNLVTKSPQNLVNS
jgi:hypothetical protein